MYCNTFASIRLVPGSAKDRSTSARAAGLSLELAPTRSACKAPIHSLTEKIWRGQTLPLYHAFSRFSARLGGVEDASCRNRIPGGLQNNGAIGTPTRSVRAAVLVQVSNQM